MGLTSTKQRIKCLAPGHNAVPSVRLSNEPATPRSRVKHSTTEPPHSFFSCFFRKIRKLSLFLSDWKATCFIDEQADLSSHCPFRWMLNLCMLGNFSNFLVICWFFFKIENFHKTISGLPSKCQKIRIKIKPDDLLGLIWVQTVCKDYQQTTKVASSIEIVKWIVVIFFLPLFKNIYCGIYM